MKKIICEKFVDFSKTVPLILKKARLAERIKNTKKILIKPNLTINLPPPNTTPAALTEEVIKFCRANPPAGGQAEIVIAEGAGGCDTLLAFRELGYEKLRDIYNVRLIDLNRSRRIVKTNPKALKLKKVKLPAILFEDYFIINLPVLKEHGAATVTCAMKNWFGTFLNKIIRFRSYWSKSELHLYGIHECIVDLNNYIKTDFSLVDASVGQTGNEVGGELVEPPIKKLIAGYGIKELDRFCCQFLNHDWREIKYLR